MLPTQKKSKSRTRTRRAHQYKVPIQYVSCRRCNNPKLPHTACDNCGFVRPGLSLNIEKKED